MYPKRGRILTLFRQTGNIFKSGRSTLYWGIVQFVTYVYILLDNGGMLKRAPDMSTISRENSDMRPRFDT